MNLYAFGFNGHTQLNPSKSNLLLPTKILSNPHITIPWTSWSDAISTYTPSPPIITLIPHLTAIESKPNPTHPIHPLEKSPTQA